MEFRIGDEEFSVEQDVALEQEPKATYASGKPVMSAKAINEKPYFVMFALDNMGEIKKVNLPISVYIYQDLVNYSLLDYSEQFKLKYRCTVGKDRKCSQM